MFTFFISCFKCFNVDERYLFKKNQNDVSCATLDQQQHCILGAAILLILNIYNFIY